MKFREYLNLNESRNQEGQTMINEATKASNLKVGNYVGFESEYNGGLGGIVVDVTASGDCRVWIDQEMEDGLQACLAEYKKDPKSAITLVKSGDGSYFAKGQQGELCTVYKFRNYASLDKWFEKVN